MIPGPAPKLFVGSSREAADCGLLDALVHALEAGLNGVNDSVSIVTWPKSPWGNLEVAVRSLMENLAEYSYAVFILSADDELSLRGKPHHSGRDNVIFEFGLFLAHLGPERTFLVGPDALETIAVTKIKADKAHS